MTLSRSKLITGMGLFAALLLSPSPSEASFAGVKSMGRANAVMASPVDSFTIAHNPAGMTWIGNRVDVGGYWLRFDGKSKISENDDPEMNGSFNSHETCNYPLPEIAVTQCICGNMVWGIAFYTKSFTKVNYDNSLPELGTSKLGFEYHHAVISPAWAIRFNDDHSLGISADLMVQRVKVNGLEHLATDEYSRKESRVTNKGYDYSFGVGWTVGWLSRFSNCLSIGLAWSPEIKMQDFKDYKGLISRGGQLYIPQRFMGGIAVDIMPDVILELDVEHVGWNDIGSLDHSGSSLGKHHLGGTRGPGLGWRDQLFWRVGGEYDVNDCLSVRIGYQHGRSPIPKSQTYLNMLTPYVVEDWVTAGFTWNYFCYCPSEFSLYAGYGFDNKIVGTDSIPGEFGGGNVTLKGKRFHLGASWSRKF